MWQWRSRRSYVHIQMPAASQNAKLAICSSWSAETFLDWCGSCRDLAQAAAVYQGTRLSFSGGLGHMIADGLHSPLLVLPTG